MKVAIVADWLTVNGGAEKVLESFANIFPEAEFFSPVCISENFPFLKDKKIHTSFLQHFPEKLKKRHQLLFSFLPKAIESLDLRGFDVVISSSSFVAKGVLTDENTVHICYCHTPTRYFWDEWQSFLKDGLNIPSWLRPFKKLFPAMFSTLRIWDFCAAQRPDFYIANSEYVQKRIEKFYRRESVVIRPPVNFSHFSAAVSKNPEDYFVALGRLIPYKKFDLLVCAFLEMPEKKLKIVGRGPEENFLRELAKNAPNIEILGFLSDENLQKTLSNARAFLLPQLEDAGIAPMEALSSGVPVIAFGKGGVLGLVEHEKNGMLFPLQTEKSVQEAILAFEKVEKNFDRNQISQEMEQFSTDNFEKNILAYISKSLNPEIS